LREIPKTLQARQIGCQVVGDSVHEILLLGVIPEVRKGQNDNRQPGRRLCVDLRGWWHAVGSAWAVVVGALMRRQAHHAVAPIPATARMHAAATSLLVTIRRRLARMGEAVAPTA
jgi:hypothetical protein